MIETDRGSLYTGITTDVARRFEQHAAGRGAAFFRTAAPVRIVTLESGLDRSEALTKEAQVKKLRPEEKRRLVKCKRKS